VEENNMPKLSGTQLNRSLAELAVQARAILKRKTKDNTELGEILQRAADQAEYGEYKAWLACEFDMTEQTAMNYRNLYRLSQNTNGLGLLKLDITNRALYRLGGSLDRDDIEEVFKQVKKAADKGRVTDDTVHDILNPPCCKVCGKSEQEVEAAGHTLNGSRFWGFTCTECNQKAVPPAKPAAKRKAKAPAAPDPVEPSPDPLAPLAPALEVAARALGDDQEGDDEADLEKRWQNSLGSFTAGVVAMRAFWKKEFGDWEKFDCPPELATLVKEAKQAWDELEAHLDKQNSAVKAAADRAEAKAAGKLH
jgi:hypothetical protein